MSAGRRIRAILAKEWIELRKNKLVVGGMAVLPVVLVGTAIVTVALFDPSASIKDFPGMPPQLAGLRPGEALLSLLGDQFATMLLLAPGLLPATIAGHSVVGEKQARSLEPLLASPVQTWELLVAKSLTAMLPAVIIGWLSYAVCAAAFVGLSPSVVAMRFVRPTWLLGMAVLCPLLALASTLLTVAVSSRTNDVRVAQGVATLIALPIIGLGSLGLVGKSVVTTTHVAVSAAIVLAFDAVFLYFAVTLFERERILTRWK